MPVYFDEPEEGRIPMRTKVLFLALLVLLTSAASKVSTSDKKVITSQEFPKPLGPYSHAVVAGGFVFVAGQGPINPKTQKMELGDIKSETRLELTNISTILKAAGSSMENVVKVSVYLGDLNDFEAMNQVYTEFFKDNYPARTTVQAVLRSGRKIEIDCIARVNQ
jgi:2-iminobutanoate/2-iminopropanoate deaminase